MTTTDDIRERVSRLEGGSEHFATKADLAQLETRVVQLEARMEARFAEMEARMEARFAEVDTRFAEMQTQIAQLENRLFLKFGGLVIATVGVAVAVLRLLG